MKTTILLQDTNRLQIHSAMFRYQVRRAHRMGLFMEQDSILLGCSGRPANSLPKFGLHLRPMVNKQVVNKLTRKECMKNTIFA